MKQEIINFSADISKFVNTAIKTPFDTILLTYGEKGGEEYYLSVPFTKLVLDIEKGYSIFFDSVYEIENTKALENRFLSNINKYEEWYNCNKDKITRLFGERSFYSTTNDTLQFTKKKIIEVATPQPNRVDNTIPQSTQAAPIFNPNYLNEQGSNLFSYLIENYEKKGKIKYINIWHFMKEVHKEESSIIFNYTQSKYIELIKELFKIEIKKFQKAGSFKEKEVPILREIANNFFDSLK